MVQFPRASVSEYPVNRSYSRHDEPEHESIKKCASLCPDRRAMGGSVLDGRRCRRCRCASSRRAVHGAAGADDTTAAACHTLSVSRSVCAVFQGPVQPLAPEHHPARPDGPGPLRRFRHWPAGDAIRRHRPISVGRRGFAGPDGRCWAAASRHGRLGLLSGQGGGLSRAAGTIWSGTPVARTWSRRLCTAARVSSQSRGHRGPSNVFTASCWTTLTRRQGARC